MRVKSAAFINAITLRGGAEKTLSEDTHQVLLVVQGNWLHVKDTRDANLACPPFGVPLTNIKQVLFADSANIFRSAQKTVSGEKAVGKEDIDPELGFRKKP